MVSVDALLRSFVAENVGRYVNIDDNPYGAQCVELCNLWCKELNIETFPGNANDFEFDSHPDCQWIMNTPWNVPSVGDIIVWSMCEELRYGHVGVFVAGNVNTFTSFDQNWPLGAPASVVWHTYQHVAGFLHPLIG